MIAFTSSLSASDVRKGLEKAKAANLQPSWKVERANRTPGDVGDWFDKAKDAKKPTVNTDGSRQVLLRRKRRAPDPVPMPGLSA